MQLSLNIHQAPKSQVAKIKAKYPTEAFLW